MIDLKAIQNLSALTTLLVDKSEQFSRALHNHAPEDELEALKQELAIIRAELKEARLNLKKY